MFKGQPPKFKDYLFQARRARAYHGLNPYPEYSFKDWKTEERGPVPRCRPFVQHIVKKSATWLYSKGLRFSCDNEPLAEKINEVWDANRMNQKCLMAGRMAGQIGSYALKFSYNAKADVPVKITVLDSMEQLRLWFDPHDSEKLILARLQYPFEKDGQWFAHREDFTEDSHIIYKPLGLPGGPSRMGAMDTADNGDWVVESDKPNPFRVIPITLVKNRDEGDLYGVGDLWELWPAVDQANFTFDLANKHNQSNVWPFYVYKNAKRPADDAGSPGTPNSVEEIHDLDDTRKADVLKFEADAAIRPALQEFADELVREVYDAAGVVRVRADEITNKGNLTQSVLMQLYRPLIELTDEKRECAGESGICKFLETMCTGLANLNVKGFSKGVDIKPIWPTYFDLIDDDLPGLVDRQILMVANGFTTKERAIRAIAEADKVEDIESLVDETEELGPAPDEKQDNGRERQETERGGEPERESGDIGD